MVTPTSTPARSPRRLVATPRAVGPSAIRSFEFKAMGSPCALHLHPAQAVDVDAVADACIIEAGRLEHKYSRYREDSVASLINASAGDDRGIAVDEETASLLDYADTAHTRSGGLFDISSGVLRRVWNFESGVLPDRQAVAAACVRVGWRKVGWSRPRLRLPAAMELDFGGYVKEYAVDRIVELCRERGVRAGLVDLGGDIGVIGPHPDGSPWRVGIRDPENPTVAKAVIALASGGLASSGEYERCMVVDGVRYGHILNPRTGWPVKGLASISVAASHCLVAGSASTIAMLKGRIEGPRFLDTLGLPSLRIDRNGRVSGALRPAAGVTRSRVAGHRLHAVVRSPRRASPPR